jgi:hypothetical protein
LGSSQFDLCWFADESGDLVLAASGPELSWLKQRTPNQISAVATLGVPNVFHGLIVHHSHRFPSFNP